MDETGEPGARVNLLSAKAIGALSPPPPEIWTLHGYLEEETWSQSRQKGDGRRPAAGRADTALQGGRRSEEAARERLLAGVPVAERRLDIGGVETAVLEGGTGPEIILLHGPAEAGLHGGG